ncbi:MAG: hypothetical protein GY782_06750 [Gammaproteobacteria bacterium]|nr:hypothetical protein [Gammaproteobacteria bacterium]
MSDDIHKVDMCVVFHWTLTSFDEILLPDEGGGGGWQTCVWRRTMSTTRTRVWLFSSSTS